MNSINQAPKCSKGDSGIKEDLSITQSIPQWRCLCHNTPLAPRKWLHSSLGWSRISHWAWLRMWDWSHDVPTEVWDCTLEGMRSHNWTHSAFSVEGGSQVQISLAYPIKDFQVERLLPDNPPSLYVDDTNLDEPIVQFTIRQLWTSLEFFYCVTRTYLTTIVSREATSTKGYHISRPFLILLACVASFPSVTTLPTYFADGPWG